MTDNEMIQKLRSLPKLPEVMAKDMLWAQGYQPTAAERAIIDAHAAFFASIDMDPSVHIKVVDFQGVRIGSLIFHS